MCAVERANNVNAVILGLNVKSIVSVTAFSTELSDPELSDWDTIDLDTMVTPCDSTLMVEEL